MTLAYIGRVGVRLKRAWQGRIWVHRQSLSWDLLNQGRWHLSSSLTGGLKGSPPSATTRSCSPRVSAGARVLVISTAPNRRPSAECFGGAIVAGIARPKLRPGTRQSVSNWKESSIKSIEKALSSEAQMVHPAHTGSEVGGDEEDERQVPFGSG
jgi:hypothetical protein